MTKNNISQRSAFWLMTSRLHKQWNKIVIRYTLFRFTCFHGTQPFGDQLLSFDFNAEISSIESSRRIPRMCNDHVSLYSEETNAETNVVLVPYLYRIVPHILSALFPALYMGEKTAIEILLYKARIQFLKCVENTYQKVGDFRSKPMNLFSLVKHHVYNKVYPCVCFCKGNCS